jgi:histidinol phosphatase-like PHP family hydrolase
MMSVRKETTRRGFVAGMSAAAGAVMLARGARGGLAGSAGELPRVDYHAHLDNSTIEAVAALGRERGVKLGIVEHAGTRANVYPVVLSNDAELAAYLDRLEGHGVYRGVQAEWTDWAACFSRPVLARLDYVLTDAMTFPGKDGQRVKLWEPDVSQRVEMADAEAFMERFVDWHVQIVSTQPIDLLANVSWLPAPLAPEYDRLWTEKRVARVVEAAVRHRVALEISASYKLPSLAFLKQAHALGATFAFGSNGRYPNMARLDYSLAMAEALELTPDRLFTPAPVGQRAVERRG